jgi:hypothetical protein
MASYVARNGRSFEEVVRSKGETRKGRNDQTNEHIVNDKDTRGGEEGQVFSKFSA